MKIPLLLTGASGLVGSRFVELFGDKYEIGNIDLTTGVDITSKDSIEAYVSLHPAASLIHLAAFTNTAVAEQEKGNKEGVCYKVNVMGTQNIAEVCKEHGIHMIHISTDFVFDGSQSEPYLEVSPLSPLDWYGETKAEAEKAVQASRVGHTILRIAYPYRANFELKPDLVKKIREGLTAGTLPPQFSDTVITPTFVDDIAMGFDLAVTKKLPGIYHLVGSSSHSPFELAQMVASVYSLDPAEVKAGSLTEYLKTSPKPFARYSRVSNAKLVQDFGFTPKSFPEGLDEIIRQQNLPPIT